MTCESGETANPRVLIVEDDKQLAALIAKQAENLGYETRCVERAADVFPAIEAYNPHIMILDIVLPDGNGLDILEKVCESGQTFPTIVITGLGDEATGKRALTSGAFDFLTKPVDFSYLKATLACALARSSAGKMDTATLEEAHLEADENDATGVGCAEPGADD